MFDNQEDRDRDSLERHLTAAALLRSGNTAALSELRRKIRPVEESALFPIWKQVFEFFQNQQQVQQVTPPSPSSSTAPELKQAAQHLIDVVAPTLPDNDSKMTVAPRGVIAQEWQPLSSRSVALTAACYLLTLALGKEPDTAQRSILFQQRSLALLADHRGSASSPERAALTELALTSAELSCVECLHGQLAGYRCAIVAALRRHVETNGIRTGGKVASASLSFEDVAKMFFEAAGEFVVATATATEEREEFNALRFIWEPLQCRDPNKDQQQQPETKLIKAVKIDLSASSAVVVEFSAITLDTATDPIFTKQPKSCSAIPAAAADAIATGAMSASSSSSPAVFKMALTHGPPIGDDSRSATNRADIPLTGWLAVDPTASSTIQSRFLNRYACLGGPVILYRSDGVEVTVAEAKFFADFLEHSAVPAMMRGVEPWAALSPQAVKAFREQGVQH